jgi:transglutaminase-like putative cysteine protease
MKYKITHETEYNYSIPVTISQHLIHLEPQNFDRQKWTSHNIEIIPKPAYEVTRTDIYGNNVTAFSIEDEHKIFNVTATGEVEVFAKEFPNDKTTWEEVKQKLIKPETQEDIAATKFLYPSPLILFDGAIKRYATESFTEGRAFIDAVKDLNHRIYTEFNYAPGTTRIGTLPSEILRDRRGVCQDFAHFMIACLRSLGLSCGYVSGYLHTRRENEEPKLIGADATHAWVFTYLPNFGYLEFDPTNDCIAGEEHIIVGIGRDFGDVSPLKGVITGGGSHTLRVAVNVEEID